MNVRSFFVFVAITILVGCSDSATSTSTSNTMATNVDRDGHADLVVDALDLASSLRIATETFEAVSCSAVEGHFAGGTYRTLRFAVTTPNIGNADVVVGDPGEHIDPNRDGDYGDSDGLFEYGVCHKHYHYRHFALYEMVPINSDGTLGQAILAKKRGFCLTDQAQWGSVAAKPNSAFKKCGTLTEEGFQGISYGWADRYDGSLDGQFFLLDNPDEPTPQGDYVIRITVNPAYDPEPGEACPVRDANNKCHMVEESDYDNNVAETRIRI